MVRTLGDPRYADIINGLKSRRIEVGLTQSEVAQAIGKPQSFVAKIEGLERRLDMIEYIDLCNAIGVDPCEHLSKLTQSLDVRSPD